MDIDKIINTIREQRILKEFGVPPGASLGGGGGGTNALTSQAKTRTIRSMLTDPTGKKAARKFHNDPQSYLTDADYQNRNKNLPPKPERKRYKDVYEMMGAGAVSGPTNNVGDGKIAGTVEAGDDPPVRKKKKYIYAGRGSRKN
jgi:hypothetical protein